MSTQIPNTETTTPDYLLGIERGHPVRVPITARQPNDSATVAVSQAPVTLSGNYTLTAADDGLVFNASTALVLTVPSGLSPRPAVIVVPPASGNVTVRFSGGVTGNAATSDILRGRTANLTGFVIQPYAEADAYGVSGS